MVKAGSMIAIAAVILAGLNGGPPSSRPRPVPGGRLKLALMAGMLNVSKGSSMYRPRPVRLIWNLFGYALFAAIVGGIALAISAAAPHVKPPPSRPWLDDPENRKSAAIIEKFIRMQGYNCGRVTFALGEAPDHFGTPHKVFCDPDRIQYRIWTIGPSNVLRARLEPIR